MGDAAACFVFETVVETYDIVVNSSLSLVPPQQLWIPIF